MEAGRGLTWGPGQGLNSILLRRHFGLNWEPTEGCIGSRSRVELGPDQGLNSVLLRRFLGLNWEPVGG